MNEREKAIAMMEAHQNEATDAYFKPRCDIDTPGLRRVYEAGFKTAWECQQARIDALKTHLGACKLRLGDARDMLDRNYIGVKLVERIDEFLNAPAEKSESYNAK